MTAGPVLYVIITGSPAAADAPAFVQQAQDDGWRPCVITSPMGGRFVDTTELEKISGLPVRSDYKQPDEPDLFPPADVVVVAPATFNTVNKIAGGISDTLAVGLACEYIGYGKPVIIAPWPNRPLARHGAYHRSIDHLTADGVDLVLTDRTRPGPELPDIEEPFPWAAILVRVSTARP